MRLTKHTIAATLVAAFAAATAPLAPANAAVPDCVSVSVDDNRRSDTVTARNGCEVGLTFKIIWANETDSACEYVPVGGRLTSERNFPARFDGLRSC